MSVEIRSLTLLDALYQRIKARAERNQRSVEDELLETLAAGLAADDELPADVAQIIASLPSLDDEALWRAAQGHLPAEESDEIEELHLKRQREGLTPAEKKRLAGLMRQYERYLMVRTEATALLKERGHNVDVLLQRA
jgi:plasmid stability protein